MIQLAKLEKSDAKRIVEWNEEKAESFLYQWAGKFAYKYPLTEAQIIERMCNQELEILKIEKDREMVGIIEIGPPNRKRKSIRFGRLLIDDKCRGNGYGSRAIQLLENYVYEKYGVEELELGVFEFNKSAKCLYEKLGFKDTEVKKCKEDSDWNSYTMVKKC